MCRQLFLQTLAILSSVAIICTPCAGSAIPVAITKNPFATAGDKIKKNFERLTNGIGEIVPTFTMIQQLKKKRKKYGDNSLNFQEFKSLEMVIKVMCILKYLFIIP